MATKTRVLSLEEVMELKYVKNMDAKTRGKIEESYNWLKEESKIRLLEKLMKMEVVQAEMNAEQDLNKKTGIVLRALKKGLKDFKVSFKKAKAKELKKIEVAEQKKGERMLLDSLNNL